MYFAKAMYVSQIGEHCKKESLHKCANLKTKVQRKSNYIEDQRL
jgi:hypothetical protein